MHSTMRRRRVSERQTRMGAAAIVLVFLGSAIFLRTDNPSKGFEVQRVAKAGSWGYPRAPFVAYIEVKTPWRFATSGDYAEPLAFRLEDIKGRPLETSDLGPGTTPTSRIVGVYAGYSPSQSRARLNAFSHGDKVWSSRVVSLPEIKDQLAAAKPDPRVKVDLVSFANIDFRISRSGLQVELAEPVPDGQFAVVKLRKTAYQSAYPSRSFPFRCTIPPGSRVGTIYLPNAESTDKVLLDISYLYFRKNRTRLRLSGFELNEIMGKPVFRVREEHRYRVPGGPVVIVPRQFRPPRKENTEPYKVADLTIWVQPPRWAWDDGNRAFGFSAGGIRPMYQMRLLGPTPQDLNIHGIRSVFHPYPSAKQVDGPIKEGPVTFDVELRADMPYRHRNFACAVPVERPAPGEWVADATLGTHHAPENIRPGRRSGFEAAANVRGGGR